MTFTLLNNIVYLLTIFGTFFLSFISLLRIRRKRQYIFFSVFTLVTGMWILAQFMAEIMYRTNASFFLIQASSALSMFVGSSFYVFSRSYIEESMSKNKLLIVFGLTLLFACANFIPGLMIKEANASPSGINIVDASTLYFAQIIFIVILITRSIYLVYKKIRKTTNRATSVSTGLMLFAVLQAVLLIGVATTLFAESREAQMIIPLSVFIMNFIIFFAMLKYQFLDVRYFILRIAGYATYAGVTVIVINLLLGSGILSILTDLKVTPEQHLFIIIVSTVASLVFLSIKSSVDKATNNIFYRKQYSMNDVISNINGFTSNTMDTKKIQSHVLKIINDCLGIEYGVFITAKSSGDFKVGASIGNPSPISKMSVDFFTYLSKLKMKQTTLLEPSPHTKISLYFDLYSIASLTSVRSNQGLSGYLILGEKRSGWPLSPRDEKLLSLISNELGLGLANAQRYEEIQMFNETLKQKVSEATAALKRTNTKLVALDDAKDEFISMASHQMRTPLTSVKGYISMLLEEDLGKLNKAQKQALKEAFDSSQRMVFLISDFLNVSRIRTGRFIIEPSTMSMPEVVKQEISQLRDMAAYKEQKIQYVDPPDFPLVSLDDNKVRQVMMNMIDNAMYYTPKGGVIDIILEKTSKEIIFKVVDSGIGVPAKEQHRLFTKFFRAANARRARPDGTGLGLFMAQKIITAQKGSIIFNSEENKGSTFGFRFPLKDIMIDNSAQKD